MGQKEYLQASIENHRTTQSAFLNLGVLLLIGITAFSNLYTERYDMLSLVVTVVLVLSFLFNLYWWVKIDTKIRKLDNELLDYLKRN